MIDQSLLKQARDSKLTVTFDGTREEPSSDFPLLKEAMTGLPPGLTNLPSGGGGGGDLAALLAAAGLFGGGGAAIGGGVGAANSPRGILSGGARGAVRGAGAGLGAMGGSMLGARLGALSGNPLVAALGGLGGLGLGGALGYRGTKAITGGEEEDEMRLRNALKKKSSDGSATAARLLSLVQ